MQVYTILRPSETKNAATGQRVKTYAEIGTLVANISTLSAGITNTNDQRFFEATDRLITYNTRCGLRAGDRVRDQDGFYQEVIWVDRPTKTLTATLKRREFANA